jgi:peroxiredoxin
LAERTYVLVFDTNGVFHIDNVPPGRYVLTLDVSDPEEEYYNRRTMGRLSKEMTVPDEPNAKLNAPYDVGTVELTIHPRLKPGMPVPAFDAKTSEGKTIKLSQFRGKPVLLYFWGLSLGYSSYDLQVLKEFQASHGASGKLAIIGCNMDQDMRNAEQFANNQGMTWTQVYLGDWNQTPVAAMFGINGNTVAALIDPEGKLVNGQLRGTNLRTALTTALAPE